MNRPRQAIALPAASLLLAALLPSCSALQQGLTHGLVDGHYRSIADGDPPRRVYLLVAGDSLTAHPVTGTAGGRTIDTTARTVHHLPPAPAEGPCPRRSFVKHGVDLDLMYVLMKFRPAAAGVPPQLNTDLNGAVYLGYRTDRFTLACTADPLGRQRRTLRERGFDAGGFLGIGATPMNATVTREAIAIEYTGLVITAGVGVFTSIGRLGFGLTAGVDHLPDTNGPHWIYQNAPWLGLSVGVNLN